MHGVIFGSLGDFVFHRYGSEVARDIGAGEPVYLMSEEYEDEAFFRLLRRACERTAVEEDELVRAFGVFAAQTTFARLYPAFFAVAGSARAFLLTVEDRIHELVRATIPNARPPQLSVSAAGPDAVRIEYSSPRRLCVLLTGLVEGTARHYGEEAAIAETACMRRGDPACLFAVTFSPSAPAA